MKPKVPKQTLQKWAEMTSYNDHIGVRISIARWLFLNLDTRFMFYTLLFHSMEFSVSTSKGNMPNGFLPTENAVTDIMLNEVRNDYGCKRLYNQINKCL